MSDNDSEKWVYRHLTSKYYDKDLDVLALNYYKPDSQGEDDFTRRQVWFYVYGDDEIYEDFLSQMDDLLDSVVLNGGTEWDTLTLIPSDEEGVINSNMEDLAKSLSDSHDLSYEVLLERHEAVGESNTFRPFKTRLADIEESLDIVGDVKGKNIILMDNISHTGASLLHASNLLIEHGANNVIGVCLGISDSLRHNDITPLGGRSITELSNKIEDLKTVESLRR